MFTLNCRGRLLAIDKPLVMGIINVTPDSFYEGSRTEGDDILNKVGKMIAEGADIVDLGGQSTRPGSNSISPDEELGRVIPAIEKIKNAFPEAYISIDTYYSKVAEEAVNAGASIVNDISGGSLDKEMLTTVGKLNTPYICMHIKGTPETMQQQANYDDLLKEILDYFIDKIHRCKDAGIKDVIIDPGFGFAKTAEHNFRILKHLSIFKILDKPILTGLSRKATVYKTLGITAEEALNGTTVLNNIALMNGANILRVHDVKEAKEIIKLFTKYHSTS